MVNPSKMIVPSQWIKKNMMGVYSEELGRPLTEAEIRVQRCLEQLQVPDWYIKYSKPAKILKSDVSIDRRPCTWKVSPKKKRTPRNTPKKIQQTEEKAYIQPPVPKNSPEKLLLNDIPADRSFNSTYRITRKIDSAIRNNLEISITSSSEDSEPEESYLTKSMEKSMEKPTDLPSFRSPKHNISNTFPRITPSRKIENINLVFPKDFSPKPPRDSLSSNSSEKSSSTSKTVYTLTKNIEVQTQQDANDTYTVEDSMEVNNSYTSFLFADIKQVGVTEKVHVHAGVDSDPEEKISRIETPNTRFFRSQKKSNELEKIVQSRCVDKKQRIQEIIEELDRSIAENRSLCNTSNTDSVFTGSFVRSMVRALEHSDSEDSDLAKSITISFYEEEEDEEEVRPSTPLSRLQETEDEDEDEDDDDDDDDDDDNDDDDGGDDDDDDDKEDVYWIPSKLHELSRTSSRLSMMSRGSSMNSFQYASGRCSPDLRIPSKMHELPRTSSRLSMMSRGSSMNGFQCTSGRCSPSLSPIKTGQYDNRSGWGLTYRSNNSKISRQLFRIDETNIADSGYDGRSDTISSRATATMCGSISDGGRSSPSPMSSLSSSPTLMEYPGLEITNDMLYNRSGPFVMKSVIV